MIVELAKQFRFEAAHTLERTIETSGSRRIHGHSYRAEIVLRGAVDRRTGMLQDLGLVERQIGAVRERLDHRLLDEIEDLPPATLENIAAWIWRHLAPALPGLARVTIYRDSTGDACSCFGE